jgi:outer membrane protein OmpA-like peptidoglycan-associated protein
MPEKEFYIWRVRSFTVRVALDFVETLTRHLGDRRLNPAEEHGGLLFGRSIDKDTVEVTDFEFIDSKHRHSPSYDLGCGERYRVERYVKNFPKHGTPKPIGYFRTHLRPGLFLDQSDFALMAEAFSDFPGIALAIRTDPRGPSSAGIFFWEDGDIDQSRTELTFPFDAAALRIQGPVEQETYAAPITGSLWAWAADLKLSSASFFWATAGAICIFAMASEVRQIGGQAQRIDGVSVHSAAPARTPNGNPWPAHVQGELRAAPNTPPAPLQYVPKTNIDGSDHSFPPLTSKSFWDSQPASRPTREADAAQIVAEVETAARPRADAEAAAGGRAPQPGTDAEVIPAQPQIPAVRPRPDTRKSELRMGLMEQLNGVLSMRDTARGLVATVPDSALDGPDLPAAASGQLARLAAIVRAHPGLRADVQVNSGDEATSLRRAEAVRRALIAQGLPDVSVTAHGLGDIRSSSGSTGGEASRRVEIVISGDPIGNIPFSDYPTN